MLKITVNEFQPNYHSLAVEKAGIFFRGVIFFSRKIGEIWKYVSTVHLIKNDQTFNMGISSHFYSPKCQIR